ncbi:MAG: hypothetical protein WAM70_11710, partial [Pyrinomonadaceae bacterium]
CPGSLISRGKSDAIANFFRVQVRVVRRMAVGDFDGTSPRDHGEKNRGGNTEPEFETLASTEHG